MKIYKCKIKINVLKIIYKYIYYIYLSCFIFLVSIPVSFAGQYTQSRIFCGDHHPAPTIPKMQPDLNNELGFDEDIAYISDLASYWKYSSLHYYRYTKSGIYGARVNYANRYSTNAAQYVLEAYPILFRGAYAAINLGYANSTQISFPSFQYGIEAYFNVKNGIEYSLGQGEKKFTRFSNQKIYTYTASIGKYINNYFIWFRPSYFQPRSTYFFEVGLKREFSDPHAYILFKLATGRLPDIGDFPPFSQMIVINQQSINIDGQIPLKKTLFLKMGLGFAHQVLHPSQTIRNITDASLGIVWIF